MNYLFLLSGLVILLAILRDIVITTISLQGGGSITNSVSRKFWQLLMMLARRLHKIHMLNHAGYLVILLILLIWVLSLWLGFFLIFLSEPGAVVYSSSLRPVEGFELFYFVGYTLSTLGNGEYQPTMDLWRLLANAASFAGLIFITLSITYFGPVLSAVILQEGLAIYINSLGNTPEEILINGWNGKSFDRLLTKLADLYHKLIQHTQNYQAYPIIFYFHSSGQERSAVVNLAKLNEVLALLKHVVQPVAKPDKKDLLILENTLVFYTKIAENYSFSKGNKHPKPDLARLYHCGIPIDEEKIHAFIADQEHVNRRNVFAGLLEGSGWSWKEVYSPGSRKEN